MKELISKGIGEARELLDSRRISARELTEAYLSRIESLDGRVKAYVTVTGERALEDAEKADRLIASGENVGPLTGIPLGIKDVIITEGIRTTCSSRMLENFVPPFNATVMDLLEQQGAVMLGKLNMDEFAMGSTTENSAFFNTANPWDTNRIPGGSSGGSAAAVAARLCVAALGSDTGGSIRQPASHCGVVGMKPTYGRVSRFGLVAFASSLDQIGPMTRNVKDCAILLQAIAGHDHRDSTSVPVDVQDYAAALEEGLKGMRVGVPEEYFVKGLSSEVEKIVRDGISRLREQGAEIVPVSLPHTEYAVAVYYIIAPAEASSNLSRFDGVRYGFRAEGYENLVDMYRKSRSQGFGEEVKRRIMIGTYCLSAGFYDAFYLKASKVRTLIAEDFRRAFDKCDVLAAPVTPDSAPERGEMTDDPLKMYLSDICTIPVNLAGLPGISVPCGLDNRGMPVGLQLIGNHFQEPMLLKAAYNLELATDSIGLWPEL
jgi:aspartyl-tRNA(Asn)/glutamyl-tRNA(Gln) amidotransferase subunit A